MWWLYTECLSPAILLFEGGNRETELVSIHFDEEQLRMSLMHPGLLLGMALTLIPILLHLLLRAKPKRLIFPALRLIQQNRRQNVRRMQLRHLWLLILRILVIALIVFALTRPSLPAANYSFVWTEWLALFVVIAAAIGAYYGTLNWWKKSIPSRQQFLTRRTMLRAGVGSAALFLLLLTVGWPYTRRVAAEIKAPVPKLADNIPVAAVFLFDTSPSMTYRKGNQTRLQNAQTIAREHLSRLPAGSKVAVTGLLDDSSYAFSLDLQAARSKVDAFETGIGGLSLNDRLRSILQAQEDDRKRVTSDQAVPEEKRQDRYLREIYLFTDLAKSSWRDETSSLLRDELQRLNDISLYLIDVGEATPTNVAVNKLQLARESIPANGAITLDAVVSATGEVKTEQTFELYLNGPDGKPVMKRRKAIDVDTHAERRLTFEVPTSEFPNSGGRYQQGDVRIVGSDPLAFDDLRSFTVLSMPTINVLVVAESSASAGYFQTILDYLKKESITDFHTKFVRTDSLTSEDLKKYEVVCLAAAASPDEATWRKLHEFVESGGGLAVFLGASNSLTSETKTGYRINPDSYNSKWAKELLPASLVASLSFAPADSLDLRNSQHLLLRRLDELGALTELGAIDVRRYWKVTPYEGAITIAKYVDKQAFPAILERRVGQGRVLMVTTSVDNVEWNDFVGNAWFWVFADQMTLYLSHSASQHCNFELGGDIVIPLERYRKPKKVVLRLPDFKQRTLDIPSDAPSIVLRDLTTAGAYQVDSSDGESDFHTGFSLNVPARESDLKRMEPVDLDALLGEKRYSTNRDPGSLERNVHAGRLGQEVYSTVVGLLVAIFALEQFTATWFYRTDEA